MAFAPCVLAQPMHELLWGSLAIDILNSPQLGEFRQREEESSVFFTVSVKVNHQAALRGVKPSGCSGSLELCMSLGKMYTASKWKHVANVHLRVSHEVITLNKYGSHLDPTSGEGCLLCREAERVQHLSLDCGRWKGLLEVFVRIAFSFMLQS